MGTQLETNFTVDLKGDIIEKYTDFLTAQPSGYLAVTLLRLLPNQEFGFLQQLDIDDQSFGFVKSPANDLATLNIVPLGGLIFSIPSEANVAKITLFSPATGETFAEFEPNEPIDFPDGGTFIVDQINLTLQNE